MEQTSEEQHYQVQYDKYYSSDDDRFYWKIKIRKNYIPQEVCISLSPNHYINLLLAYDTGIKEKSIDHIDCIDKDLIDRLLFNLFSTYPETKEDSEYIKNEVLIQSKLFKNSIIINKDEER